MYARHANARCCCFPSLLSPSFVLLCVSGLFFRRILAIGRFDISKGTLASVELSRGVIRASFKLDAAGNGLVATESFAHVNQAALAFSVALLQLLASCGQSVDKRRAEAIGGAVALDHDAVTVLKTFGQGSTCNTGLDRGLPASTAHLDLRMSLHEDGIFANLAADSSSQGQQANPVQCTF